jgi:hypothetical protein
VIVDGKIHATLGNPGTEDSIHQIEFEHIASELDGRLFQAQVNQPENRVADSSVSVNARDHQVKGSDFSLYRYYIQTIGGWKTVLLLFFMASTVFANQFPSRFSVPQLNLC